MGDFRSQPGTDYADLVKQLHDHAQYFAAGHGPLHAAAANAIDHLMTLNRLMAPGIGRCDAVNARALSAFRQNLQEAWAAMAMIRETIETLGPVGAVKASEHLDGPTFMHEAEALVAGITALAVSSADRLCAKCGCETKREEALVNGEIWCHPCADNIALPSTHGDTP